MDIQNTVAAAKVEASPKPPFISTKKCPFCSEVVRLCACLQEEQRKALVALARYLTGQSA